MARSHLVRDRQSAIWLGLAGYAFGTLMLWDAFENRGKSRPFWMRFAGGGV